MSKVDEDEINLNDSFNRMNTSKLSDEYDPLVAVFSSSVTASTASNDEEDDSDEWEKHSIEKRRNRTLTPTRTRAINMTFSPRVIKKDLFKDLRNFPFSRSNSPEDKQLRSQNDSDKISSEDTQKLMESSPIEKSVTVKEDVDQLQAALERFTLTSPIAMPQSKPRSIYDLKEKVNDDDTRMSSLPVEMPISAKLSLEANINEIKTWSMLVKRETLKIKEINQEEIMTTTTTNILTKSDTTSDADKELIGKLQAEIEAYKDREKKYVNHIANIVDQNEQFQLIADEFEKIFKQFVVEKDANEAKLRKEIIDLTKERDHLQEDVVGIEQSFDNLHKRFENLKSKVNVFKTNEDNLQKVIESYKQQLEREKMKYSTLKKHAEEKLDVANVEIEKLRKNTGIEIQSLKAELKRSEIKINSMELNIQQKDQENSQLTNLLEDLLNKVKPNNAAY